MTYESSHDQRHTCPNCGAKPLDKRYPAHVKACTGEPPGIRWFWSQGWRAKLNVIFVTLAVIVLSVVAPIYNELEEAYDEVTE